MAIDKQFYLYCVIILGVIVLIQTIITFIAKQNIWMKLKSIGARKSGKILVKFNDESKGYYEDFIGINQGTVTVMPPWMQNSKTENDKKMMVGISPSHIYFDSNYGVRAINCNPRGSYYARGDEDGQEIDQAYITGEMAEAFITRALCSPDRTKTIDPKHILMVSLIAVVLSGLACYFAYKNNSILTEILPLVKQLTSKGVL